MCQCGLELTSHRITSEFAQQNANDGDGDTETEETKEERIRLQAQQVLTQLQQQALKWDSEQHTILADPDSYGTICFEGFGQEASRKAPVRFRYSDGL